MTAVTTEVTMVEALNRALRDALENDPATLIFGQDVGRLGGVFRVTADLQAEYGATRVFDMPIAESGIVGVAVGLAIYGYRPIVELQFDGFSYPAFNQIITHVSRYRTRTYGSISMPLVIRMPFAGGVGATEHHSESPEAYFAHTPGLKVVVVSNAQDAYDLLTHAIRDDDPVLFLESKARYWQRGTLDVEAESLPPSAARIVRPGKQCTIVTYGPPVQTAVEAAEELAADGIEVEVLDLRSLTPLDIETVVASVRRTGRAVVVHEAPRTCGFGAELAAQISSGAFLDLESPVVRVCGYDVPYPAPRLEESYLPGRQRIVAEVRRAVES
jgi:2-oxoisovalerate dehydrogenase E1 component beta subunit